MSLHQILLQPTDVVFFRDGRPMAGSLAGHTAAWPSPNVTNYALHAALHRADLANIHQHRRGRSGSYSQDETHRDRKFGSLVTAGPFPVRPDDKLGGSSADTWFFPRPADSKPSQDNSIEVTLLPAKPDGKDERWTGSSLPDPLKYAVGNKQGPNKDAGGEPWISELAFSAYLRGSEFKPKSGVGSHFLCDSEIADREHQMGIGIDPETQAQNGESFYSAHYLRQRDEFRLGLLAKIEDQDFKEHDGDLIEAVFNGHPTQILVGGQQRVCTARCNRNSGPLPLPKGLSDGFNTSGIEAKNRWMVKWVLLTPAIWPEIPGGPSKRGTPRKYHPGGWLPNWICHQTGSLLLEVVSGEERRSRRRLNYDGKGYASNPNIQARLVAAIVPKPQVVTGWALPNKSADHPAGGAKSTHLAVPAGAVYYFEAGTADDARKLAAALNWHGSNSQFPTIGNRRSTLFGEKGFGLGVCGTWSFFQNVR